MSNWEEGKEEEEEGKEEEEEEKEEEEEEEEEKEEGEEEGEEEVFEWWVRVGVESFLGKGKQMCQVLRHGILASVAGAQGEMGRVSGWA